MLQDVGLLERECELQVLRTLIADASQGAGRLIVVEGTAGIGKTSLVTAARAEAQRAGMRVLTARGLDLEREFAYGVVRQLFEPTLAAANESERNELLAGPAEQAATLFGRIDPTAKPSTGGDVSFARLHGLFWLTANLCAPQPLMLAVDDLHWADAPSLRFLVYLLPRLEGLRLLVLIALRPAEPGIPQHLLNQITTDVVASTVRLAPLSQAASVQLVRSVLGSQADEAFCAACHDATRGNPLLLHELADVAAAENLAPTAEGAVRLVQLGPRVIGRRVALRLARLGPAATALCKAVAILGDGAQPVHAAALAELELTEALQAARQLIEIEILYQRAPSPDKPSRLSGTLGFVHPLVRAAIYEWLSETERLAGHARAAELLDKADAGTEQIAAHLLLIPPADDIHVVATLRRAANEALARGSPDSAVAYLERCLQEPPPETARADILLQLGTATQLIDMAKAADYLAAAMAATQNLEREATIAEMLGLALFLAGYGVEATKVWSQAIRTLGEEHVDLRRRLEAALVHVAFVDPAQRRLCTELVSRLRDAPVVTDLSSWVFDVTIAFYDTLAGQPSEVAVARARRALTDDASIETLVEEAHGGLVYGCLVLIAADLDEVMPLLDAWVAAAHRRGSMLAYAPAKTFRGLAWLCRGALAEAETDLRDAKWAVETTAHIVGRPIVAAYLADVLIEQGRLDEAAAALDWASVPEPLPPAGHWHWFLESRARLLMLQERIGEGLEAMYTCGRRCTACGWQNPAIVAWCSGAALALLALDRREEARKLAAEELTLARRWGAPRALGRALRIAGLVQGGEEGLVLLHQAVEVLAASPARLEHAKALIELGAALRRSGQRLESRQHLRHGVELAQICGATPLVERGWTELRASGARPRHIAPSGPDALTPSERRVAELAAVGHSNRDIAQKLFITINTVEVHLTRVYRKLDVTRRADLAKALRPPDSL
jgi:DNA-binding CsgD family transcriptional regulator/predicted negative regulator of RcsB-dependent stress response